VVVCAAMAVGANVRAATVVAPTFAELVARAQVVFVGDTVGVESRWVTTPAGRSIVTRVTFRVARTLKGDLGVLTVLEFKGGRVGEDSLVVPGMPRFRVGDRDLLFVDERGGPVSPVLGFAFGRFRVVGDPVSGRESVASFNYEPLASTADIGAVSAPVRVRVGRALTLRAFEDEITAAVRRLPAQQ
jgi:hypothetical protein